MDLQNEDIIRLYRVMLQSRTYEERITQLVKEGKVASHHSGMGHEAVGAGTGIVMRPSDAAMPSHRSGLTLSFMRGRTDLKGAALTSFGKGGSSGPASQPPPRYLRPLGLVGSQIPLAVGAAMADKLKGNDDVTLCFMGDGAANRGDFHEGVNLAAARKLPIVFIIENNGFAISMPSEEATAIRDFADRAQGYGMPGVVVDGNDVLAVYEVTKETISRARQGLGPSLIEFKVYRWMGHSSGDSDSYRTDEYRAQAQSRCPVARLERELISRGILAETECQALRARVAGEVEEAISAAAAAPPAQQEAVTPEYIKNLVYAE